jgi:hypothetical protein
MRFKIDKVKGKAVHPKKLSDEIKLSDSEPKRLQMKKRSLVG